MAIDKRSTPTWVKVVIVIVALSFVALPVIGAIGGSGSLGGSSTTGTNTGDAYTTIAQQYSAQTQAYDQALASEPTSYTVLVNQANTYFDWAAKVQADTTLKQSGADKPIWLSATTYYDRALNVKAGDPSVGTDLAISYYYSGNLAKAIETVETVVKSSPDFAAARFNAGIFYKDAGRTSDAITAFEQYVKLDPKGTSGDPSFAQQSLTELRSSTATTITPSGP